MAYWTRKPS